MFGANFKTVLTKQIHKTVINLFVRLFMYVFVFELLSFHLSNIFEFWNYKIIAGIIMKWMINTMTYFKARLPIKNDCINNNE